MPGGEKEETAWRGMEGKLRSASHNWAKSSSWNYVEFSQGEIARGTKEEKLRTVGQTKVG